MLCCSVFIFVSEILNRIVNNVDDFYNDRIYMCEAINLSSVNVTEAAIIAQGEDVGFFCRFHGRNCVENAVFASICVLSSGHYQVCVSKLAVETIELAFVLECIYAFGFLIIGVIITHVTKKSLICKF